MRFNPYHDPSNGQFISGGGGGRYYKPQGLSSGKNRFRFYSNGGGSGVDKSVESDIISNRDCFIHPDKVNKYFLKPGAKHSNEFFDVGYTVNDGDKLTKDLTEIFDYSKAVEKSVTNSGAEKFSIFAELGVSKKKRFRTVWQKDTPKSKPRIITAHRED